MNKTWPERNSLNIFIYAIVVTFLGCFLFYALAITEIKLIECQEDEEFLPSYLEDTNSRHELFPIDTNIVYPSCPDCYCEASCSASLKAVEGCHIPEKFFRRKIERITITGYSNIPTMFAGNELTAIELEENEELIPGCFYRYKTEDYLAIHRLLGVYPDYLAFRGDNNDSFEKIQRENLTHLILGVNFK